MKYMKLTDEQKERHPSIHYTGSVRGMKKLGYWGKHDVCVRCGQYIYNISIWLDPNRSNKTERPKEELPQAYLDILEKREWSVCDYTDDGRVELEWYSPTAEDYLEPGDKVDEDLIGYFLDVLPPRTNRAGLLQVGGEISTAKDVNGRWQPTYLTFKRQGGTWRYAGRCFEGSAEPVQKYQSSLERMMLTRCKLLGVVAQEVEA